MSRIRILAAICATAAAALASPPAIQGFMRMDELEAALRERIAALKEKEEFEAKPRPERLVLLFQRGVETYEKKDLTGDYVVEEVFGWDAVRAAKPQDAAVRTLALLPGVLGARFGPLADVKTRTEKRDRYATGKALANLLTHDRLHVRQAAFACLQAIYGRTHDYRPDAPERERKKAQRRWRASLR